MGRPMSETVHIRHLSKSYGTTRALADVTCSFGPGIHALVGGNGSGKSTLVKVIAGVAKQQSGTVQLNGHYVQGDPQIASRAGVRVVHQSLGLVDELSVADNFTLTSSAKWWQRTQRREHRNKVERCLSIVNCGVSLDALTGELSEADRTFVALARVVDPEHHRDGGLLLLLDEVTASLAADDVHRVVMLLDQLAGMGHCIVMVTHRLAEVQRVAESALVLRDGRVAALLQRPFDTDELAEAVTGEHLEAPAPNGPENVSDSLRPEYLAMTVDSLGVGRAKNVSITLRRGEIVGLAGLVGSGRTSLLRAIGGHQQPSVGRLLLGAEQQRGHTASARLAAGVSYLPDSRAASTFPELSVTENVMLQSVVRSRALQYVNPSKLRDLAAAEIAAGDVKCEGPDVPMHTLSGGNQQKLLIRRLLRTRPNVAAVDEPTHGVDVGARRSIHDALRESATDGLAVLYASSDEQELAELGSRVVIMRQGENRSEVAGTRTAGQILKSVTDGGRHE
jgi:ribose transport system ATP-binding protein